MPVTELKVFISSPGDVGLERDLAKKVLERLQGEFGAFVKLTPYRWEEQPLSGHHSFQENILPPSQTQIMVGILWSRLGTPLSEQFGRKTGTEWEFDEAARSYKEKHLPELLVYRKTARALVELGNEELLEKAREQFRLVNAFIEKWSRAEDGSFRAAFKTFTTSDEFETKLENDLREVLRKRLHEPSEGTPPFEEAIEPWTSGSPFRRLQPFNSEHERVFFGRNRAIGGILAQLKKQAGLGCAFVLIHGASGSGKSSVVRAGILPRLKKPGFVQGIELWRSGIFLPSDALTDAQGKRDLCSGLARTLLRDNTLNELGQLGLNAEKLGNWFRDVPQHAGDLVRTALEKIAKEQADKEQKSRAPEARLVLVVDQMEELFTLPGIDVEERERFVAVLDSLARGPAWVLATMRGDCYPRCAEIPALASLTEESGSYHLLQPRPSELADMIRLPAAAAGLHWDEDDNEGKLDDALYNAAVGNPRVLPLLEFTLDELYEKGREDRKLTWAAYRAMKKLPGAIGERAEAVFRGLRAEVQKVLPSLLSKLVTVGAGPEEQVTARRVYQSELQSPAELRELFEALDHERLLVSEAGADGRPVVGVAHEALLEHWPRCRQWIEANRAGLLTHRRLTDATQEWTSNDRQETFLYHATRLMVAHEWAANHVGELDLDEKAFLKASERAETRRQQEEKRRQQKELEEAKQLAEERRRTAQRLRWGTGVLAALTLLALGLFVYSQRARDRAEQAEKTAKDEQQRAEQAEREANEGQRIAQNRRKVLFDAVLDLRLSGRALAKQDKTVNEAAGFYSACVSVLNAAHADNPDDDELRQELADAYSGLAWVRLLQKRYKDALNCASMAVDYVPERPDLKVNLAHAYMFAGRLKEAAELYRHCKPFADEIREDFKLFRKRQLKDAKVLAAMEAVLESVQP